MRSPAPRIAAALTAALAAGMAGCTAPAPAVPAVLAPGPGVYDAQPQHLWNRLHDAMFVRRGADGAEYGRDRIEPLLWRGSMHLLRGEPHRRVLSVLDEFNRGGESLVSDPLRRAMLQRDLWLVFNWLESSHDDFYGFGETPDDWRRRQYALRAPLARAIASLALAPEAIAALPDTYAAAVRSRAFAARFDAAEPERPYLPADLFATDGPWVPLGRGRDLIAAAHVLSDNPFTTSAFLVFIKLPGSREATRAYVERLAAFEGPRFVATPATPTPAWPNFNPAMPQFPAGTEVALVRQALLVSSSGEVAPTRLVENVQVRVYRTVPAWTPDLLLRATLNDEEVRSWQASSEFTLSRARLFAGVSGGLRAASQDDGDFLTGFSTHGNDAFESVNGETRAESSARSPESLRAASEPARRQGSPLDRCVHCHNLPGVYSFNTYVQNHASLSAATVDDVLAAGAGWKRTRPDWKLLRELMAAQRCERGAVAAHAVDADAGRR